MPSRLDPDLNLAFERPWFPGLAERLVGRALSARGLTSAAYRTRRWIEADPSDDPPASLVEPPPPSLVETYAAMGLCFAAPPDTGGAALLREAWRCLEQVPDVGHAASALVRAIHVLAPPGVGYDISHSDPELPCSIFLSLPVGEPHATLRTAESILHEAMHLQLTLLEARVPVVRLSSATLYSPWQQRQRPVSGLVHGLYVFAAIDAYLAEMLSRGGLSDQTENYLLKRRREIAAEIGQVTCVARHEDLTPFGRRFVTGLLSRTSVSP